MDKVCLSLFLVLLMVVWLAMWSGYFSEDELRRRVMKWKREAEEKERGV